MTKEIELKDIESIIAFLNLHQIKVEYKKLDGDLNRTIEFEIEGVKYYLDWWINQSYLKTQKGFSKPNLPCKFMAIHDYSPTTHHKYLLCFYDIRAENRGQFVYSPVPFGAFKIPFNIKN